jgi:hypothetical protein
MKLEITFGAMAPKLRDQIAAAGFKAYYKDVAEWQADADAITRLTVRGLLSDSQIAMCRKRLTRLIAGGVAR